MAWWFGRKSAPEPVRPLVPSWLGASGGEGFARSYEAQFDEVYRNNPIGQRAVRLVSGLVGSLSVYATNGEQAAAKLVGSELLESIAAALLLHGNAYVQLLAGTDDRPEELVLLRPGAVPPSLSGSETPTISARPK